MQVTEKLARHIIWLCGVAEGETGESEDELRHHLEEAFPVLKQEREEREFDDWLWSIRVENEADVKEARFLLGEDIPFEEVYYAENMPGQFAAGGGETYQLYREHREVASHLFFSSKTDAGARLIAEDAAGDIDLKAEWDVCRRIKENGKARC